MPSHVKIFQAQTIKFVIDEVANKSRNLEKEETFLRIMEVSYGYYN